MDRRTAFNFMLSRPVIVAAAIGGICGNFTWCLAGGVLLEIIGLMDLPVGTRISKDDTFAAFAYSYVISGLSEVTPEYCFFILIISYLLMYPVTYTIVFTRWINKILYLSYPRKEGMLIFAGQAISFLRGVIVYAGGSVVLNWFIKDTAGKIIIPEINFLWLVVIFCFVAGYFSGFLHESARMKTILLLLGGAFAWIIL